MSQYQTTAVTVPAATTNLVTLLDVLGDLNITDASSQDHVWLRRVIAQCSIAIANQCNRTFGLQTYTLSISVEKGPNRKYRQDSIQLNAPLTSVTSVTEDSVLLVQDTDYHIDYANSRIYRLDSDGNVSYWPNLTEVVVYKAGWLLPGQTDASAVALPADLQDATIRLVSGRYRERGRDPYVKSETVDGVLTQTFFSGNGPSGSGGNFPSDIADIISNYRTPVIA